MDVLESGSDKYWVFGNYSAMDMNLIPSIVANLDYSVLEYDYKYCRYRSPQKHQKAELKDCDCHDQMHGKMISAFYYGAKSLWWMSEAQMYHYQNLFPFLNEKDNVVLSSVFDDAYFLTVKALKNKYKNTERKGWVVLGSTSWVKGAQESEKWCIDNKKDYEVVWGLEYGELLEKLAQSEGFVYLPAGWDTCPRMVIEAKMLGCELVLNDNVQHKDEIWFETEDPFDTEAYLFAARERFWNSITQTMNWQPTISGYTTVLDCIDHGYPWQQSIKSMLGFCNQVCVVDGGSTDGTWEQLQEWADIEPRLKIDQHVIDMSSKRFAVQDGQQKARSRKLCDSDFCWQMDADEIVHEKDYEKILSLAKNFPGQVDIVTLPVVEYWGGPEKIRIDVTPWKWRFSRNKDHITHGIPSQLRKYDEDNELYSGLGTDGCDYINNETYEVLPHAGFYTADAEKARNAALQGDEKALEAYRDWTSRVLEAVPSVLHYSWYDLPRKIKTYRDYWSQHWQSLYDIEQEDTSDNNMFFDKPWSEVSDDDIESLAKDLKEKMGGWVFHSKVDFDKPTPYMTLEFNQPLVMKKD